MRSVGKVQVVFVTAIHEAQYEEVMVVGQTCLLELSRGYVLEMGVMLFGEVWWGRNGKGRDGLAFMRTLGFEWSHLQLVE